MKTYCKNIDLTDIELIRESVHNCIRNKPRRRGLVKFIRRNTKLSSDMIYKSVVNQPVKYKDVLRTGDYWTVICMVANVLYGEILNGKLQLSPIQIQHRIDACSLKTRTIGIQSVKQHFYDHLAVLVLKDFIRRIGEFQVASIRGRGQSYGLRHIKKWIKNDKIKYVAQLDISKCYESIDKKRVSQFLSKYIKNAKVLWFINSLLSTHPGIGISIGSYLSQYICNLFLSQAYHFIKEKVGYIRQKKTCVQKYVSYVKHVLFYMDDILLLSTNKRHLDRAILEVKTFLSQCMGLSVKSTWRKFGLTNSNFIDSMGFRIYRDKVTIRKRIFVKLRRIVLRLTEWINNGCKGHTPISKARSMMSYYSYIIQTHLFKYLQKYRITLVVNICRAIISNISTNYALGNIPN